MKALSLRQPWAHAVLYYGKTIENRTWTTQFRGLFAIHAAMTMTPEDFEDAEDFIGETLGWDKLEPPAAMEAACAHFEKDFHDRGHRGGVVGVARLERVILRCSTSPLFACEHRWHIPDQYGYVLSGVRPVPFVACKGMPGFFELPADVAARVQAAL